MWEEDAASVGGDRPAGHISQDPRCAQPPRPSQVLPYKVHRLGNHLPGLLQQRLV